MVVITDFNGILFYDQVIKIAQPRMGSYAYRKLDEVDLDLIQWKVFNKRTKENPIAFAMRFVR